MHKIPEGEAVPEGFIKVGNDFYRQSPIKPVAIKDGEKLLGYGINYGGKFEFIKNEQLKSDSKYKVGELKTFTEGKKK